MKHHAEDYKETAVKYYLDHMKTCGILVKYLDATFNH